MLAGDPDEAAHQAEEFLKDKSARGKPIREQSMGETHFGYPASIEKTRVF
jgi:hypothetical protein